MRIHITIYIICITLTLLSLRWELMENECLSYSTICHTNDQDERLLMITNWSIN